MYDTEYNEEDKHMCRPETTSNKLIRNKEGGNILK